MTLPRELLWSLAGLGSYDRSRARACWCWPRIETPRFAWCPTATTTPSSNSCACRSMQVAVEGLHALKLEAGGALAVVTQRALWDCDAAVRAAAVRALVACARIVPEAVSSRARLDLAPRVRRGLIEELQPRLLVRAAAADSPSYWAEWVLYSLRDRSAAIRAAATRCLAVAIQTDPVRWSDALLSNIQFAESTAVPLASALVSCLWQAKVEAAACPEDRNKGHLGRWLSVQRCVKAVDEASPASRAASRAALLLRLAVAAGKSCTSKERDDFDDLLPSEEVDAGAVQPLLDEALRHEELPASTGGRAALARSAASVLLKAPPQACAEGLLHGGVLPGSRMGLQFAETPPSVLLLGTLLLRRVVSASAKESPTGNAGGPGVQRSAAVVEAWFSKAANTTMESIKKSLEKARREKQLALADAAAAREELDSLAWEGDALRRRGGSSVSLPMKRDDAEAKLQKAEAAIAAAHEHCDDLAVRSALAAGLWLKHSRASLAHDPRQRVLLNDVLHPVVQDADASSEAQAAAVLGIAVYASRSAEHAVTHWQFFISLMDSQLPALRRPCTDSSQLQLPVRMAEIAVLFLSDAISLHNSLLGAKRVAEGMTAIARLLQALDTAAGVEQDCQGVVPPKEVAHLRAVICDRVCCLMVMAAGADAGTACEWLLGRLLAFVCGIGSYPSMQDEGMEPADDQADADPYLSLAPSRQPSVSRRKPPREEMDSRMENAVMCSRILRFLAMMPMLSANHAALLVTALESFFAARLFMLAPRSKDKSNRATPAVRAARLVIARLSTASESLAAAGLDARALQLHVLRCIGAARVVAPPSHAGLLNDALAAAVVAAKGTATIRDWLGDRDAQPVLKALADLLGTWSPSTAAKAVDALLLELRRIPRTQQDHAWQWVQDVADKAADFRSDVLLLGLVNRGFSLQRPAPAPAPALSERGAYATQARRHAPRPGSRSRSPRRQQQPRKSTRVVTTIQRHERLEQPDLAQDLEDDSSVGEAAEAPAQAPKEVLCQDDDVSAKPALLVTEDAEQELLMDAPTGCKAWKVVLEADPSKHWLLEMKDPAEGLDSLTAQPRLIMGRSSKCDVVVSEGAVSSTHCSFTLEVEEEAGHDQHCCRAVLSDLGSVNGTFVNGQRLTKDAPTRRLEHGDVVALAARDGVRYVVQEAREQQASERRQPEPDVPEMVQQTPAAKRPLIERREEAQEEAAAVAEELMQSPPKKVRLQARGDRGNRGLEGAAEESEGHRPKQAMEAVSEVKLRGVALSVAAAAKDRSAEAARLISLASGAVVNLPAQGVAAIGRRKDCEVFVDSPVVSSRHCALLCRCDGGRHLVEVEDMSSHGTFVNGVRLPRSSSLPQRTPLRNGDQLTLAHEDGPSFLFLALKKD
eukprot:TRINITY_DN21871_c0_g1_i5.p1 TRINITY_DN21871_c0_g1~~TRINITY_DN21871_c0_g1_i5.p1  ORF type:complete len:1384 (-),score=304.07 TRINITY_DN21871_c0_g1_i5:84-4235(-)